MLGLSTKVSRTLLTFLPLFRPVSDLQQTEQSGDETIEREKRIDNSVANPTLKANYNKKKIVNTAPMQSLYGGAMTPLFFSSFFFYNLLFSLTLMIPQVDRLDVSQRALGE